MASHSSRAQHRRPTILTNCVLCDNSFEKESFSRSNFCADCRYLRNRVELARDNRKMFEKFDGFMQVNFYPDHFLEVVYNVDSSDSHSETTSIYPLYRGIKSNHHDPFGNMNLGCKALHLYELHDRVDSSGNVVKFTIKSARIHPRSSLIVLPD
jgi:hypothetical protein